MLCLVGHQESRHCNTVVRPEALNAKMWSKRKETKIHSAFSLKSGESHHGPVFCPVRLRAVVTN